MLEPPVILASAKPLVVAHIVTFNHESCIEGCVKSLCAQEDYVLGENLFVEITDNNSSDTTPACIQRLIESQASAGLRLHQAGENTGFTGAHNNGLRYLREHNAEYLLVLNPDVALCKDALAQMVNGLCLDSTAGSLTPKLRRANAELAPVVPHRIDAAGMILHPSWRHFDRGSNEVDSGQYDTEQYVFGGTGACLLLRKDCIEDCAYLDTGLAPEQRLFHDDFFAYREDAELAWRMQRLGWRCRYHPKALAYHVRKVTPERRAELDARINMLGVQNRFLLQLLHIDFSYWPWFAHIALRNLLVLGAVCCRERRSLKAFSNLARKLSSVLAQRRVLSSKARIPSALVAQWFGKESETAISFDFEQGGSSDTQVQSIDAVIVNYNSGQRLLKCLQSLSSTLQELDPAIQLNVHVVDNASEDASASRVAPLFRALKNVHFLFPEENLGFAGAIELVAKKSKADALLILNPDVTLDAAALEKLVTALTTYPDIAAIAPRLLDENRQPQTAFSAKRLPSLSSTVAELLLVHRIWPNNPWTQAVKFSRDPRVRAYFSTKKHVGTPERTQPFPIEQPPAACFLVRSSAYRAVDGFDTQFWPAWFEDVDFCKRLKAKNLGVAVLASSSVAHEGGYSLSTLKEEEFRVIWYSNLKRYWKKHGSFLESLCIDLLVPVALILRALTPGVHATAGNASPGRRQQLLSAAWRLARSTDQK